LLFIGFLNPQGNFDPGDSYWMEHPDFGGQLVYVKETALALGDLGHRVDIITRQIDDPDWPEFSDRIESSGRHNYKTDRRSRLARVFRSDRPLPGIRQRQNNKDPLRSRRVPAQGRTVALPRHRLAGRNN